MASVDLAAMRAATRELCAQESQAPTTAFVDTAELDARVNEALSDLRDLIIETQGQEWASVTATIALTSGVTDYDLPVDFDELLGARLEQGSLQAPIYPWEYADVSDLTNEAAQGAVPRDYRYRIRGTSKVSILPAPSTSLTLYLDYIPRYVELAQPTDLTYEMPYGAWKWAALAAAIELLAKEQVDSSALQVRLAQKEERIRRKAARRQVGAHRIKDTRRDSARLRSRLYPSLWSGS